MAQFSGNAVRTVALGGAHFVPVITSLASACGSAVGSYGTGSFGYNGYLLLITWLLMRGSVLGAAGRRCDAIFGAATAVGILLRPQVTSGWTAPPACSPAFLIDVVVGAGGGNRTRVSCLEGRRSTIELRPRLKTAASERDYPRACR